MVQREEIKKLYTISDSTTKDSIVNQARKFLIKTIASDIFPFWYGTEWDFNGATRIPGQGKIACGYFVTNILTDVGFNIPRVQWAQSASEVFIKKLAKNNIKRFSNRPISEVEKHLQDAGDGLYLVGLDSHVGFIIVKNNKTSFVHSNYYQPEIGVMSEKLNTDNPLKDSDYRVIGKLMSDEMIVNWILNTEY
ncbi:MAG: hypothetical protein HND50_11395 [Calditrichaeota bacterium]|nr:hypothetical protein [Calditrichota bacterium]